MDEVLRFGPIIKYLARDFNRRTPPNVEYDDLESQGWLGALRALATYDAELGSIEEHVRRRARGSMQDWLRRVAVVGSQHFRPEVVALDETAAVCYPLWRMSLAHTLWSDLMRAALSARNRGVLTCWVQGDTWEEIAKDYGISPKRVRDIYCGSLERMTVVMIKRREQAKDATASIFRMALEC